jgi:hypothetical protein
MPDLLAAARDAGLDAISFHQLMVTFDAGDGITLVDLLDAGRTEDVLRTVRAGGE